MQIICAAATEMLDATPSPMAGRALLL
jgi:hypothetical protein